MKLLYVSKALTVATYRDKVRELRRHAEVTAVIPNRWQPPPEPVGDGEVLPWPVWFPGRLHVHVYRDVHALLARFAPDLCHIDEEPYSAVTWQLMRACRTRGIPALFFAWQNIPKTLPPPFGAMRSYVFRHAAGAIAGTAQAARTLRALGYAGPLATIPQFGVDADRFAPRPDLRAQRRAASGVRDEGFVVGFAGRLVPEKGVGLLLEALEHLPAARLLIVGDGPDRERLERTAATAHPDGRVRFAGRLPSIEMPAWLCALDVLVLPSRATRRWAEQFGRVLVEAMACGVPVVGSDSGEIPEVIGAAGLTFTDGSVTSLAAALQRLAASADLRARLGRLGRERVLEQYTSVRVARETVDFYHGLRGRAE